MTAPIIGREILRHFQVMSTNTLLREHAEAGVPEGLVITAEEQLAGRGRLGRKWIVPAGTSLQFSVLLRPPLAPSQAARLVPMASLAVAAVLERELHLQATLKWPNDVLLNGKKVCGILTESGIQGNVLSYVVLGIGLNVNYSMRSYPDLVPYATTLYDVVGHYLDRDGLERALFKCLEAYYARICRGENLDAEYRAKLAMLGQAVRVVSQDKVLQGIAVDVDQDGALVLQHDGERTKLYAGDVTILKS